ncbi:ras-domain-containing protein [Hysterangium stoloniferum]|nr:ras-domain-containing protein [Hysterangium stoloniferum]
MRTIKLVIIGDSGVGKTSLRSHYVSGRFSTGYRATIGTDFITKTLPHHSNPEEVVTLQIWDTAGQERFSSLATAFFRGADAVLMVYGVNRPESLQSLKKWWHEFQARAPVADENASDYCCVVVGNKIDLLENVEEGDRTMFVTENEARVFLEDLIPIPSTPTSSPAASAALQPSSAPPPANSDGASPVTESSSHQGNGSVAVSPVGDDDSLFQYTPIDIQYSTRGQHNSLRATSSSQFGGTMTTTHTGLSVYHTPSSSLFDEYVSAPSSPPGSQINRSPAFSSSHARPATSSSSSETVTPSMFAPSSSVSTMPVPLPLDRGPKLFLASAKSGHSVSMVFEYIVKRVVMKWEWEENIQRTTLEHTERPNEIRLTQPNMSQDRSWAGKCCS